MSKAFRLILIIILLLPALPSRAWEGMDMPVLHVDGRYLKDEDGNIVNLHGFAQTYSPWFNEQGTKWSNYDVNACLKYNKQKIDGVLNAGWKMNFLRLHMDPYWSNDPAKHAENEADISAFNFTRFKTYLNSVFIPMAEYAISKGLYVVMRPPGVCPENIAVGDEYHEYLKKVWGYVASQSKLVNNPHIMFELANEPIKIKGTDGVYGANTDACNKELSRFFQQIVDIMREKGCNNILWIPGTGYQSQYAGYAKYPITGQNIGYAVHVYPGWYGSDALEPSHELGGSYGGGYNNFAAGWAAQIKPVADFAPIMVTEMDWAPSAYNASWGKSITGTMLNIGFGANFKLLADNSGNVSWLIFTGCDLLEKFKDEPGTPGSYTFQNDPEACPWPTYHWFKDYAGDQLPEPSSVKMAFSANMDENNCEIMTGNSVGAAVVAQYDGYQLNAGGMEVMVDNPDIVSWSNGCFTANAVGETAAQVSYELLGSSHRKTIKFVSTPFPFSSDFFNPSIWETGTFNPNTHEIKTGQYGFAGWKYPIGLDLSDYNYLIAEIDGPNNCAVSFRVFDIDNYWSDCAAIDFGSDKLAVLDLKNLKSTNNRAMDASHIYIAGFWSYGSHPFKIANVYVSDNPYGPSDVENVAVTSENEIVDVYTIMGVKLKSQVNRREALTGLSNGIYAVGGKKVIIR